MSARGEGRLLRWLTRLWPADFRRAHGDEALADYVALRAERAGHPLSLARFWVWVLVDVLATAVAARRPAVGRRAVTARAGASWLRSTGWTSDVRQGFRQVTGAPGFSWSMVLTLALGIGATTAVFTVIDTVLVRPIPYADPEELVDVGRRMEGGFVVPNFPIEVARQLQERASAESFVTLASFERLDMVLGGRGEARDVRVQAASRSLFDVLGRSPALGRGFSEDDVLPGAEPVALVSHGTWRRLGSDPGILGSTLELDGSAFTIIGILPSDFRFPTTFPAEVFIPLDPSGRAAGRVVDRLSLIGRLSDATTLEATQERLDALADFVREEQGLSDGWSTAAIPMGQFRTNPDVARALWLAAGAVGLMFLIAIVNGFNLLLARLEARAEELAVRASLGASRGRLLRQTLMECLILALFAGGLAVALVAAGVGALMRAAPPEVSLGAATAIVVDERMLGFAFLATVAAGLGCALFPALLSLRWADAAAARGGRAPGALSRDHARVRSGLVIGQVSLAMTLLMGAGLLIASFARLLAVDPGFDPDRLALLSINPNERAYATADQRAAFGAALEERLLALPGVDAVARADGLPPRGNVRIKPALQTAEDAEPRPDSPFLLPWATVGPEYLDVLGVPVVEGRNFTTADGPQSNVVIIDRDLAAFLWSGGNAVGRRFRISESGPWLTVVGIVEELMLGLPDGSYGEHVVLRPTAPGHDGTYFAIRGRGAPEGMIGPIRDAVTALDPRQPIYELSTARGAILDELQKQRFFMTVVGVLAAVALTLTAIGLYGLLNFLVQRRAREIGIRMALGARARTVLAGVLRGGLSLVAAGLVLGLAGAVAIGRFMRGIIFEVEPGHPGTLLVACAILCTVAVLACLVPAGRAARVDPASVMKRE